MTTTKSRDLRTFPRIPRGIPVIAPACIICGCTQNAACPGGCAWETFDAGGVWGVCSACLERRLCIVAETLVFHALDKQRWSRRNSCPCPLCKKPARRKK